MLQDFPKIPLAKISVGQKKLEFSQPRNILDQNISRDKSRNILDQDNIWGDEAKPGQAFPSLPPFRRFVCSTRCLYPCPLLKLLMILGTGTRYIVPGSTRVTHGSCARHRLLLLLLYGCSNALLLYI